MKPLTCEEAAQRLHTFLDRELDVKEVAEVRTHLENCAECHSKFRFEASFRRVVRTQAGGQPAPTGLRDRIGQPGGRRGLESDYLEPPWEYYRLRTVIDSEMARRGLVQ